MPHRRSGIAPCPEGLNIEYVIKKELSASAEFFLMNEWMGASTD
jgi:hypothetical protein